MADKSEYFLKGRLSEDKTGCVFDHGNMLKRVLIGWEDKDLEISIKIFRKNRSSAQNRYWHGVMIARIINFYKETEGVAYTIPEVKAYIYKNVLGLTLESKIVAGQEVFVFNGKRMSKRNTVEFNEGKEKIQEYYALKGCDIPDPREQNFLTDYIN